MIKLGKIELLDDIQIDKNLSKHLVSQSISVSGTSNFNLSGAINNNLNRPRYDLVLTEMEYEYGFTKSLWLKFKIWLYKNFYLRTKKKPGIIGVQELQQFFDNLKNGINELDKENIDGVLENYEFLLNNAKQNKQLALCEKIEDYSVILKNELILSTSEFNKFLDEDDVVEFYEYASKHEELETNLCLTYIKNFVKIIPREITELKNKADQLEVFDNYVILHYDYDGNSVADTKEEIEKKKDPILFGVIRNSRRLYYIGDWIDTYCDLTLDVLIKTIGIEEKKINKETIFHGLRENKEI